MINETDQRIHYPATISKRRLDGTECGSDYLDPGEELIEAAESRKAQQD